MAGRVGLARGRRADRRRGALRELREETGFAGAGHRGVLRPRPRQPVPLVAGRRDRQCRGLRASGSASDAEPTLSDEHDAVPLGRARARRCELVVWPAYREALDEHRARPARPGPRAVVPAPGRRVATDRLRRPAGPTGRGSGRPDGRLTRNLPPPADGGRAPSEARLLDRPDPPRRPPRHRCGRRPAAGLPVEGRHDPPDLRLRGRQPGARDRARSSRTTSTSPRRSAGSTSRSRSSPRRWTPSSTPGSPAALARLGGLAVLNLEGVQARYDDPDAVLARIAAAPDGEVQDLLAEAYARADPRGAHRPPDRGDPRRRLEGRRRRHAGCRPPVRAVLRRARRRPVPRPEPGLERPPPRHRLRPAVARRVHPVHADPGRGRQHDERRGGLRAHGAGRRGGLRRGRPGRGLHDPRGPRDRRARRSPRSATSPPPATPTSPRPAATSRSSPTAGCAAAASWPRRSPPAPTS